MCEGLICTSVYSAPAANRRGDSNRRRRQIGAVAALEEKWGKEGACASEIS
jgi:hypothetical protein